MQNQILLQGIQTMFQYWRIAKLHQRSNRRWCSVELCNFVLVNYFPVTIVVRIEWSAFKLSKI